MRLLVYQCPANSPKPLVFEISSTLKNLANALFPLTEAKKRVQINDRGKYRYTPSKEYIEFISNLKAQKHGNNSQKSREKISY